MQSQQIQNFKQFQSRCFAIPQVSFSTIITKYYLPQSQPSLKIALLRQFITTVTQFYDKFLQSHQKLCIVFFSYIKDQFKDSAIEILTQPKFSQLLFEYENFFDGNDKQLRVYKRNYDLQLYLCKYKLNKKYEEMKTKMDEIVNSMMKNKREMNVLFSLDEDYSQVQEKYKSDLKEFQKMKKKLLKLLDGLLDHFMRQEGRFRFNLKMISILYKGEIEKKADERGLLYSEILITKSEYQVDISKLGRYLEREDNRVEQREERKERDIFEQKKQKKQMIQTKESSTKQNNQVKIQQMSPLKQKTQTLPNQKSPTNSVTPSKQGQPSAFEPAKISSFRLISTQPKQVKLSFDSPSNNNSPILHYNIYKINSNTFQKVQTLPHIQDHLIYQFTLTGYGYTQFTIKAENSLGESLRYEVFQIIIPSQPNSQLFMRGQTRDEMIPNAQQQQEPIHPIKLNMNCCQIVVSNCVMICDSRGYIATWGRVYCDQTKERVVLEPFTPFQIQTKHINKISCADEFYLCSDLIGNAYGFGRNMNSQLGIPKLKGEQTINPVLIPYFDNKKIFITDIACKGQHSIALDSKGNVYSWGINEIGAAGYPVCDAFGNVKNFTNFNNQVLLQSIPRQIEHIAFGNRKVVKIAIGQEFAAAINEDGQLYTWGANHMGQLGIGKIIINHAEYSNILCPAQVSTFNKQIRIIDINIGSAHSLALCLKQSTGQTLVYSWGNSQDGQCGHGQYTSYYVPQVIQFFKGHKVQFVRAGNNISFVKTDQGLFEFGIQQKEFKNRFEKLNQEWAVDVVDVASNGRVDAFLVGGKKEK